MNPEEQINEQEMQQILNNPFYALTLSLVNSAMISLGKIPNPVTNAIEKDFNQARVSIDMLGMLADKTKGNLSSEEDMFLKSQLTELRMLFAREKKG